MADTTFAYTPGTGGSASVDRITGTDYPHYKIKWGAPGTVNDADITSGKPFPIQLRGSDGTDRSNLLPVSLSSLPALAGGSATIGKVDQGAAGATPWPVSLGTGTANDVDVVSVPADPFGANVDAANVSGSISAKLRALATAIGAAILTRGVGTSDANTLRTHTTIDPSQLSPLVVNSVPVITGGNLYKQIAGGSSIICTSTEAALGAAGTSYLEHIVIIVTDPTNCNVQVRDGSGSAWYALPNDPAGGVGVYHTAYGILNQSAGGFTVSAAAGSFAIVTGRWP